ncbi:MAG: hypothetical protein ABMB14_17750 [Myxococcota bacterium]
MWWIVGCAVSEPIPPGLPDGVVRLAVRDDQVRVGDAVVQPFSDLAKDPTEAVDPALSAAVAAAMTPGPRPVWVSAPPDLPFWGVRRLLGSARDAGAADAWLSIAGSPEVFPISPAPRYELGGVCEAPIPVRGVEPLITVSIQTGADGEWALATARFVPVTERGPTDGLAPECLAIPPCDALFPDGPLRAACLAPGDAAPERVGLGGDTGCLLPIAKQPEDVAGWRPELTARITALGLGERPLRIVMPEARSRLDAVVAVVGAFVDAGLPAPAIGATLLVEGNDGPPVCNASVQDRDGLALAGARWIGGVLAKAAAPPPAEATGG